MTLKNLPRNLFAAFAFLGFVSAGLGLSGCGGGDDDSEPGAAQTVMSDQAASTYASVTLQGEDGTVSGGARVEVAEAAQGAKVVGGLVGPSDELELVVDAAAEGSAEIVLRYRAGSSAPGTAVVFVEGVDQGVIALRSTGAMFADSESIVVPLASGRNRVRLHVEDGDGGAVQIDSVRAALMSKDFSGATRMRALEYTTVGQLNEAPSIRCRSKLTAVVGTQVGMNCSATDDGLPSGSSVSVGWTLVTAPSGAVLGDLRASGLTSLRARFVPSVYGTYVWRLSVSDGAATSTTNVNVDVTRASNAAPVVSCDILGGISLGNPVRLGCAVGDDGLPSGSKVTTTWSIVAGPSSPLPPLQLSLDGAIATFTPKVAGSYRVRVSASDGALSTASDVLIVVPQPVTKRLQPLGASITNGYGQQSYRYALWKTLIGAGAHVDFVGSTTAVDLATPVYPDYMGLKFDPDHEGHSGYTTWNVASGLATWMAGYAPDVTLIFVGTNDLLRGDANSPASAVSGMTSIVQNLRAKNPGVHVYVAQLTPVDPTHPGFSGVGDFSFMGPRIRDFNGRLPAWAAGMSTAVSPVVVVDQYTGFDARVDTYDGIHPVASGEAKLAASWYAAIRGEF